MRGGLNPILASLAILIGAEQIFAQARSVITPPPEQGNGLHSALGRAPAGPSNWDRIQDSIDRSIGRIPDDALFQSTRMQEDRDARLGLTRPQTEFDRFHEDYERQLRIDQQKETAESAAERKMRQELDRRQIQLFRAAQSQSGTLQQQADEKTLTDARVARDQQILQAARERADALRKPGANEGQIETQYLNRVHTAQEAYQTLRKHILGYEPAPATQPAT
jgi:hypothetical protein